LRVCSSASYYLQVQAGHFGDGRHNASDWSPRHCWLPLLVGVSLTAAVPDRLAWNAFSPAALQEARAGGRPVFVDFTAAWCLSCQVNERVVLHDAAVERELTAKHYIMLRADWTRYDPEITALLHSVGRDGVPTYVVFPSQPDSKALVLPELLTRSEVLNALGHSGT